MATQYEQGPEARAMETGFALDELLRRERGANRRQAGQQAFQRGMADVNQAHALDRMVKGEELKEQFAQREAERSAPFLQQLIGGNPQVAKTFGFTQPGPDQIQRSGAMTEPEAMGIQAPIAPGPDVARRPTTQEAAGLARAVPGIAQTLLQQSVSKDSQFTLGKGQTRFDSQGRPIASVADESENDGSFATFDEAQAEAQRQEAALGQSGLPKMRPAIEQNAKGRYVIKRTAGEPVTPQDPNKIVADMEMKGDTKSAEYLRAKSAQANYNQEMERIAGAKAYQQDVNKPFNLEDRKRLDTLEMTIQSAYNLMNYTPAERESFTGAGKLGWEAARYANEAGLPLPFGYTPEGVARYSDFVKNNGMIEQYKFAIGGKQLTVGEQRVVEAFIPTGREKTSAEYEAKLRSIAAVMEAGRAVDMHLSVTGKVNVSPEAIGNLYRDELRKRGIDVTGKAKENIERNMSSGERLRNKYGQP